MFSHIDIGVSYFGRSVSLSGDTLAVSGEWSHAPAPKQGRVFLFDQDSGGVGQWGVVKTISSPSGLDFDGFGAAISLQGDALVIGYGAPYDGSPVAAVPLEVYVYQRHLGGSDQWGMGSPLQPSNPVGVGMFGYSVSLWGNDIAVGAPGGPSGPSGKVFLYEKAGGVGGDDWQEKQVVTHPNDDYFGVTVSLQRHTLAVASPQDRQEGSNVVGRVFIYRRDSSPLGAWVENDVIEACYNLAGENEMGPSLALYGETLAIGDTQINPRLNGNSEPDGGVLVFRLVFRMGVSAYDEWKIEHFGDAVMDNPNSLDAPWADLSDEDLDDLSNLEEAYRGLSPMVFSLSPQDDSLISGTHFIYRWKRALDYRGIQAIPYWSPDMTTWYASGDGPVGDIKEIVVRNLGAIDGSGHEVIEAGILRENRQKVFLRIEFTQ